MSYFSLKTNYRGIHINNRIVAIMGPGGVGKSCLALQYLQKLYLEEYDP
jgi:GTPase SAR1 family protein